MWNIPIVNITKTSEEELYRYLDEMIAKEEHLLAANAYLDNVAEDISGSDNE